MDRPQVVLVAIISVLLAVSIFFVLPFLNYFLLAILLAYVLKPIQHHLAFRLGKRVGTSVIVLVATFTLVVPAVYLIRTAYQEARNLIDTVRSGEVSYDTIESYLRETLGIEIDVSEAVRAAISDIGLTSLADIFSIVGTAAHVLIGIGFTIFLLYYFLKDGDRFLTWVTARMPLRPHVRDELFGEIRSITRAVLMGHVLVAIIQGLIAGIGLIVLGIPNAAFWTIVMVALAVLPIIGSFLVWGPAVVWLAIEGQPVAALALLIYGTIVVGISDDYLRPIIVDRYARVNPAVIIIGVLGGIYVIGFMGIFFGPVIVGALKVAIDLYDREVTEAQN